MELLEAAWREVEAQGVLGSCTAVITVLEGENLHVANLGDSGFMVSQSVPLLL